MAATPERGQDEVADDPAAVQTAILESVRTTDLGAVLAAQGITTVGLDDVGRMIERHPDGTERVIG